MKIAIDTINRYLKKSRSTEDIVRLLDRTEIEVEEVLHGAKLDNKIILAKTIDVEPHPNADRLRLVTVTTGTKKVQVVCGAPNVAVEQRVALVQPGATLPDGTSIASAKLRGVVSHGMLASARELGLSDDHTGILVLEEDRHKLGTSLCDIVFSGDILDIKTPANRWDYLSGVGIAREIAAHDTAEQGVVLPEIDDTNYQNTEFVNVKETGKCGRFLSARIRIKNDVKSPAWLVDNLEANGFTAHNPVVDITNFVMLETGQPSHAYDALKLLGPLAVRFAERGERLTTLDGIERILTEHDLVVADKTGPIGLAGVMGSAHTEIDETTTEIILEAAHFDKTSVRRSALRHGLRTEASARFERGLPLPLQPWAFARLVTLLQEICDAQIIEGPFDQLMSWPWQQFLGVRLRRAERFLGMELAEAEVMRGLKRLGFKVEHFSLTKELRSHLGKPYVWGANFREHGESAFDCSYLVDRLYSKLGVFVGHTALGQFHTGWEVDIKSLKPGDVLFIEGKIEKSVTDHYYLMGPDGKKIKHSLKQPMKVGHNGVYIGNGQVIHAATYKHRNGKWVKRRITGVITSPLEEFTQDSGFLGARRYLDSFNHILALEVPWWRSDIRQEVDVYEEIAKLVGYEKMPETLPQMPPMPASSQSRLPQHMQLRRNLIAAGATEVMTYSFISQRDAELTGQHAEALPTIANPRTPEQAYLRSTLLSSHLKLWQHNAGLRTGDVVFEISRVFTGTGRDGELPVEDWCLAMSAAGPQSLDVVQALFHRLLRQYHLSVEFSASKDMSFVPQRSSRLTYDRRAIGHIGQVRTGLSAEYDLRQPVAYAELALPVLLEPRPVILQAVPEYQLTLRDVSIELAADIAWQDVAAILKQHTSIVNYSYRAHYQDEALAQDNRQVLTVRLWFDMGPQPTGDEISAQIKQLITHLQKSLPDSASPKLV